MENTLLKLAQDWHKAVTVKLVADGWIAERGDDYTTYYKDGHSVLLLDSIKNEASKARFLNIHLPNLLEANKHAKAITVKGSVLKNYFTPIKRCSYILYGIFTNAQGKSELLGYPLHRNQWEPISNEHAAQIIESLLNE